MSPLQPSKVLPLVLSLFVISCPGIGRAKAALEVKWPEGLQAVHPQAATRQPLPVHHVLQAEESADSVSVVDVQPPVLDFKDTPICVPTVGLIDVVNNFPDRTVRLLGMVAHSPHLYPAMFQPQVSSMT